MAMNGSVQASLFAAQFIAALRNEQNVEVGLEQARGLMGFGLPNV